MVCAFSCAGSIYTGMYLYPKGTLCCEHMDMAMDGLYSENAGAIFCVQEQYFYRLSACNLYQRLPESLPIYRVGSDRRSDPLLRSWIITPGSDLTSFSVCLKVGRGVIAKAHSLRVCLSNLSRGLLLAQQVPPTEILG